MKAKGSILPLLVAAALAVSLHASGQNYSHDTGPVEEPRSFTHERLEPGQSPPDDEFFLEPGYELELVLGELTFPSSVAFGDNGTVYVLESGYSYGSATAIPRILRVVEPGVTAEVARLPDGPLTGLEFHDGSLYTIGGRAPAEVWRVDPETGNVTTVLTGFPVWGHHFTSQLAVHPEEEKLYFAVGYPSNSGVIGLEDFYEFQYLSIFPEAHDIPCIEHTLVGQNFETLNPFTDDPNDTAVTGAFKPYGEPSEPGEVIEATEPPGCNGAVFRANLDGSDLEVYATGFRNPWGINFAPDGRLFLVDHGMDAGGSRPVANDLDPMWVVEEGGWYGFPDYPSGFTVTLPGFDPVEKPRPEPVLKDPPSLAGKPFFLFAPSAGTMHFDFSTSEEFGFVGDAFVSQYGSQFHNDRPAGYRIERLNMTTRTPGDFYVNQVPGPNGTAPERPVAVKFTPQGDAMYLVDFGKLATDTLTFFSSASTGGVWRVTFVGDGASSHGDGPGGSGLTIPGVSSGVAVAGVALAAAYRASRERYGRVR